MKCDQSRPACNRCLSTGRTCDGEIGTAIVSTARERSIKPHPGTTSRSLVSDNSCTQTAETRGSSNSTSTLPSLHGNVSPWRGLDSAFSDHERHGFSHFRVLTAPAMQMMLPSSGWIPVALQMSLQHPAIFHAITATGTMARALTVLIHPSFPRPILHNPADEAVPQYRKAIRSLRQYVDQAISVPAAIEPILLACLLCVCFEVFRGKKAAAIDHARLGWKIVNENSTSLDQQRSPSLSFFKSIFPQHAGAHALFDDKEHHDSECCQIDPSPPPSTFGSAEQATEHLTRLVKLAEHLRMELLELAKASVDRIARMHGLQDEVSFCLAACLSRTVTISDLHQSRLERLKAAHIHWKSAYARYEDTSTKIDVESHLILRIKLFFSNFTLATCRDSEETPSDAFKDDFQQVLTYVERYLAVAERERLDTTTQHASQSSRNQSKFFGFSILPTLHLIAHKCRDPQLRRRALHLLSTAQKQEGLEDSGTLGLYAQAAVEIEERRAALLTQQQQQNTAATASSYGWDISLPPPVMPEQARIADCVVTGMGAKGIFKLSCARYVHEHESKTSRDIKQIELTQYEGGGAVPLRLLLCQSWNFTL